MGVGVLDGAHRRPVQALDIQPGLEDAGGVFALGQEEGRKLPEPPQQAFCGPARDPDPVPAFEHGHREAHRARRSLLRLDGIGLGITVAVRFAGFRHRA
ncbi:hypothetical protein D3C72_2072750 [compost metagenome]